MTKAALKKKPSAKEKAKAKVSPQTSAKKKASNTPSKIEKEQIEAQGRHNSLVEEYYPYATSIANRVSQTLSSAVDYEDVLCNARLGLLEAAQRFDPSQGIEFRTFAYYRIKGAIYDGLRKSGWLPRSVYAKIKFEEAANDYLQHASHKEAIEHKQAQQADNSISDTVNSLASIYVISLDANEDIEIEDHNGVDVEQRTALMQVRNHMRHAINSLPPKEKQLIMMYYFQNRTLEESGRRLGLSKSWTSRLHARALELLMSRIKANAGDDKPGAGDFTGEGEIA